MTTDQKVRGSTPLGRAIFLREVAQLGRALGLGPRGRRFESCLPDHYYYDVLSFGSGCLSTEVRFDSGRASALVSTPFIFYDWVAGETTQLKIDQLEECEYIAFFSGSIV